MIRFGPSGNDIKFYSDGNKSSVQAPAWLSAMGLGAYEVNFGRGVKMGEKMAAALGEEARKYNISVSVHTPYYINLASADPSAIKKSYAYIRQCLEIAKKINASDGPSRLVIHVGSQCELERSAAIENCKKNLKWTVDELVKSGFDGFLLCIETMGRYRAIGTYREICGICKIDPHIVPTIDFGHINCIEQGELQKNPGRMREIIDYCIGEIGFEKMRRVHVHFSAIEFTAKGEHAHTVLDDPKWAFPFEPLAEVIKEKGFEPIIICESEDIMAQDAKRLDGIWKTVTAR